MKSKIEKVKKLKAIYLEYDDGSIIAVPEDKTLRVGTAFMASVGKEQFTWTVVRTAGSAWKDKIKKFFEV